MTSFRPIARLAAGIAPLVAVLAPLVANLGQPIVENYVGRQVPTAMVARNLARGSGFLRPRLDTGPFPNLFPVEPPIAAGLAAAVHRSTGLPIAPAGRLGSALATTLGAWGLLGLVRRRDGEFAATVAALVFGALPITLRYGRAVQPDALALGGVLAGLRLLDGRTTGTALLAGCGLLMIGLASKILYAAIALPALRALATKSTPGGPAGPPGRPGAPIVGLIVVAPAILWYGWAAWLVAGSGGSRAPLDNAAIWASAGDLASIPARFPWRLAGIYLAYRSFSPVGIALAAAGFRGGASRDRLWATWGVAASAFLVLFAAKAHHEYYWWVLAPWVAAGVGRGAARLATRGRWPARAAVVGVGVLIVAMIAQARSTWTTPRDWASIRPMARAIDARVAPWALVAAPEALLFEADRRGCRLEWEPAAVRRAAGEWGGPAPSPRAIDLVDLYRARGASLFADLPAGASADRSALHAEVRRRFAVIQDDADGLIADLSRVGGAEDARR